ncbi:MAG: hypothetical protein RLZZ09_2768 [Pseudomonadota bacterium]
MSQSDHSRRVVFAKPVLMVTLGGLVMGCTENMNMQKPKAAISEVQACSSLKSVLSQANTGFTGLRGSATTDYDHTRWDAQPIIPGTECDVIGWGGGRTNYACAWNKGSEASALSDYQGGLGIVQRCLGPEWTASHPAGQTGQATLFSKGSDPAKVEVRYYKERDPSSNWQTSLTIGPAVTRDAR